MSSISLRVPPSIGAYTTNVPTAHKFPTRANGGVKRNQEDHATMEYDGSEVEVKAQRISSTCLGIGSDDIASELNAEDCEAYLRDMAEKYQEALGNKQCFVHVRAKKV